MGKGSGRRPTNEKAYGETLDAIFGYIPPYKRKQLQDDMDQARSEDLQPEAPYEVTYRE